MRVFAGGINTETNTFASPVTAEIIMMGVPGPLNARYYGNIL